MPCMCGDLYCWSCGPAQGNDKCPACSRWTLDEFYRCPQCKRVFDIEAPEDERCDKCGAGLTVESGCFDPNACEAVCRNQHIGSTAMTEQPDRMLKWFTWTHLPERLQGVSQPFQNTAFHIVEKIEPGPERTVALRKLLEAKDAAVRAVVHPGG